MNTKQRVDETLYIGLSIHISTYIVAYFVFGGEKIGIAIDFQAKTSDVIAIDKALETQSSHSGEVLILCYHQKHWR